MVSAGGEVWRDWWEVSLRADLEYKAHANDYVEEEVTVEEPEARVGGPESNNDVAVVRYSDGVLCRGKISLLEVTLEQTSPVEVESVL